MLSKPLAGRTILVTRSESADRPLETGLRRLGARVIRTPVIRIQPPADCSPLDAALQALDRYDAAVFTSRNAVAGFFARARRLRLRLAAPTQVFAVGPRTAQALAARGWKAAVPETHHAEALARAMGRVRGWRILLPRAQEGREVLLRRLRERGARVDAVTVYRTVCDRRAGALLRRAAAAGVDVVTFASGSAVENLLAQLTPALRRRLFARAAAASIGPVTTAALERRGLKAAIEAPRTTMAGLCRAIAGHFR